MLRERPRYLFVARCSAAVGRGLIGMKDFAKSKDGNLRGDLIGGLWEWSWGWCIREIVSVPFSAFSSWDERRNFDI